MSRHLGGRSQTIESRWIDLRAAKLRFGDRTYLARATVAIAFLQRVSPQSVGLSFMADFRTDASGLAILASSYFANDAEKKGHLCSNI